MAETINTNEAASTEAQNAETKTTLNLYYWSTDEQPFAPAWVPFKLAGDSYPLVAQAPDPDIKSPKYDWKNRIWIDNMATTVFDKINKVSDTVKDLTTRLNTVAAAQTTATKSDQAADQKMDQMLKLITMTNAQLGALTTKFNNALAQGSKPADNNSAAPATAKTNESAAPADSGTTAPVANATAKEGE